MNHHLGSALEDEHHGLQEARFSVEAETLLAMWPIVLVIQGLDPLRPFGGLHCIFFTDTVLECARVDLHAAK